MWMKGRTAAIPKKEYIERVALIRFAMKHIPNINGDTTMKAVKRALKAAPASSDVAEIFDEFEKLLKRHCTCLSDWQLFHELKKKYLGGERT